MCKYKCACYRPQRSCGKVMFSQASVILFTGGGDTPQTDTPWADTPFARHPPADTPLGRPPWADTPRQTCPRQPPPGQTPLRQTPQADTPQADTPSPGQTPLKADTPPPIPQQTATAADSTHPTRMHSCYTLLLHVTHHSMGPTSRKCMTHYRDSTQPNEQSGDK